VFVFVVCGGFRRKKTQKLSFWHRAPGTQCHPAVAAATNNSMAVLCFVICTFRVRCQVCGLAPAGPKKSGGKKKNWPLAAPHPHLRPGVVRPALSSLLSDASLSNTLSSLALALAI
jgi:hypothetical protein